MLVSLLSSELCILGQIIFNSSMYLFTYYDKKVQIQQPYISKNKVLFWSYSKKLSVNNDEITESRTETSIRQ